MSESASHGTEQVRNQLASAIKQRSTVTLRMDRELNPTVSMRPFLLGKRGPGYGYRDYVAGHVWEAGEDCLHSEDIESIVSVAEVRAAEYKKGIPREVWQCPKCLYDLRGLPDGVCPECGLAKGEG